MPSLKFAAASIAYELNSSWSKTVGASYIHQSGLAANVLYLHVAVPWPLSERVLKRVAVMCTPVAHAGILPASLPRVTVIGVAASGSTTQIGQSDDTDLNGFFWEQKHVIGSTGSGAATPNVGGDHDHDARGVLVNASIAGYAGIRLEVRGESGTDSIVGLKIESVVFDFDN
jgi:hypothetical protein